MSRRPSSPEGKCRDCSAPVYWAETERGMRPFDREPSPNGKFVLFKRPDGTLRAEEARPGQQRGSGARTSHFFTCSERKQRQGGQQRQGARHERAGGSPPSAGANAAAFGKVVSVQVIVQYENGTVLRFRPQSLSEVVPGQQQRRSA